MTSTKPLKQFSTIAVLEGVSYLLFAITMPLKYKWDMLAPNYYVGMLHGLLFVLFLLLGLRCWIVYKWKFSFVLLCFATSLIPFGTFWLEKKRLKPMLVSLNN